ncbi:MAG: DUF3857 domain-containing protein [Cytophagales bacterium]|nr:DUF3857 domain-containing protein [Cytophagales bacterium]
MKKIVRNRCFLLAFLAGIAYSAHAQNDPVKFGKVEMADLQMKTYDKDTSAAAVVLCDYGKADFQYNSERGFQIRFERLVRIKILKKSGYEWATGEISLYRSGPQNEEKVSELKGYTYNLANGQIAKEKLEKEAVFTEKKSESWSVQKFTLPNVREGSVVEYTYTTVSDFLYPFQEWDFQNSIPVLWSEYRALIPEYFNYRMQSNGYEPFHINTNEQTATSFTIKNEGGFVSGVSPWSGQSGRQAASYDRVEAQATKYRWVMKDVPAIRPEAYTTTPQDYMSRIEFELASTNFPGQGFKPYSSSWPSVADLLLKSEDFGTQLNRAGFLKESVAKIKAGFKEPAQQAMAAYELLRQYMTWNGEKRMFSKDGTKKAFETRTGNSADINLMLVAMLRELGLESQPVLLSTRDHGRVLPYYSMLNKFNYVVASVVIGDQRMLLDATDSHIAPGLLPTRCLNGIGRVIDANGGDWINLETKEKAVEMFSAQLALNEDGELTGQVEIAGRIRRMDAPQENPFGRKGKTRRDAEKRISDMGNPKGGTAKFGETDRSVE